MLQATVRQNRIDRKIRPSFPSGDTLTPVGFQAIVFYQPTSQSRAYSSTGEEAWLKASVYVNRHLSFEQKTTNMQANSSLLFLA